MSTVHYTRWDRFVFKLTGRWPQKVVDQRLASMYQLTPESQRRLDDIIKETYRHNAS